MAERFWVQLGMSADEPVRWVMPGADGSAARVETDSLSMAATRGLGRNAVVLIPGTDVLMARVLLPSQNRQRLMKAVPFALEEQLTDDVESLHFTLGQRELAGELPVVVAARAKMDDWLARLAQAGIQPQWLIPEFLAVPVQPDEWTVLFDQGRALVRTGPQSGFGADADTVDTFLRLAWEQTEARPNRIRLIAELDVTLPDLGLDEVEWVREETAPASLLELAAGLEPAQAINLLQGEYSAREKLGKALRPWRPVAALLMLWLLSQGAVVVAEQRRLQSEGREYAQKIEALFRTTFPDARKVVDPRVQMERRISRLRKAPTGVAEGFVGILAQVGPWLKRESALRLKGMNYRNERLDLDLSIADLQKLDKLKRTLSGETGLSVEIVTARSAKDYVDARLRIQGSGA